MSGKSFNTVFPNDLQYFEILDAMIQREPDEGEEQTDIIMLTHQTREKNIDAAIARIEKLTVVKGGITRLRLEALL